MARESANAAYEALHKDRPWHNGSFRSWATERSDSHPFYYTHGVTIGVADFDAAPWDLFTTEANASPVPAESGQVLES